jgi:hypothetical protein
MHETESASVRECSQDHEAVNILGGRTAQMILNEVEWVFEPSWNSCGSRGHQHLLFVFHICQYHALIYPCPFRTLYLQEHGFHTANGGNSKFTKHSRLYCHLYHWTHFIILAALVLPIFYGKSNVLQCFQDEEVKPS